MKRHLSLFIWLMAYGWGCQSTDQTHAVRLSERVIPMESPAIQQKGDLILWKGKPYDGFLVRYHTNGQLADKKGYWQGQLEGLAQQWYAHGQVAERRYYSKGQKAGIHRGWWENGQRRFVYQFAKDIPVGTHQEWYDTGQSMTLFSYNAKGQPEGPQRMWYATGQVKANYVVKNGRNYGLTGAKGCMGNNEKLQTAWIPQTP